MASLYFVWLGVCVCLHMCVVRCSFEWQDQHGAKTSPLVIKLKTQNAVVLIFLLLLHLLLFLDNLFDPFTGKEYLMIEVMLWVFPF